VVVFTGGAAAARVIPLEAGSVVLGRGEGAGELADGRVSRRHALVALDSQRWRVTDLGSQNGTFVDGVAAAAHLPTPLDRVIRVGDSLVLPCDDLRRLERLGVRSIAGFVRGPAMQAVLAEVEDAARAGSTLHIRGESGTGKEGIAQAFHRAGSRAERPFVAVNCAAIPHAIAERLVFGAKRGAYSGADADAVGYVEQADGGTLFLDEIAELEPQVQGKLLRVLESHEVLPLGASRPRKVNFGLCSATNKDLRALVATGALREDLYFRIGQPFVALPGLRNRPEEIPGLIAQELAALSSAPAVHVSFVEQCLLRPWPGNVRELLTEIRAAVRTAMRDRQRIEARHLAATAGTVFGGAMPEARPATVPPDPRDTPSGETPRRRISRDAAEWRQRIEDALRANAGNVAATARALGLHRTQLRRLVERHGIAIDAIAKNDGDHDGDGDSDGDDDGDHDE
jgi:transcriptional regulator with GAF, ATPase, and Fis domain